MTLVLNTFFEICEFRGRKDVGTSCSCHTSTTEVPRRRRLGSEQPPCAGTRAMQIVAEDIAAPWLSSVALSSVALSQAALSETAAIQANEVNPWRN
jgi:hypothetical protein